MSSVPELRAVASAALMLAAATACNGPANAPASTPPAAASPPAPTATPFGRGSGAVVVQHTPSVNALDEPTLELPKQESFVLLDAGKPPRTALRYRPSADFAFTVETRLSSRHLQGNGFTEPVALPAIHDGFAISITAGAAGRLALRGLTGTAATPSPEADAYLTAWRTQLQDRAISLVLDERGGVTQIAFGDDPTGARSAAARDELAQRLLVAIVPLPAEPVGRGASWRATTVLRTRPGYAKQTATYTLASIGPAGWKLHIKVLRVGEEQHIVDPALPAGTTADLLAMFRVLEGDVVIDPARPLIHGALAIESRLHVRLQAAGQPAIEQMTEDTGSIVLAHRPPAAAPEPVRRPPAATTPRAP